MSEGRVNEAWQGAFEDLGRNLSETTFVVVDLETSGGSPEQSSITEIGAVKVRGGEIIGEFQTLINPGGDIPAYITVLTGITNSMVISAPSIQETFPSLLEFFGSPDESVVVAHNAPFDLGFLKAAAKQNNYVWPNFQVVDTARLARQVLTKDEVPNCKLGTLAIFFRARTSPTHRALDDARATVDVLHGIFERLGSFGVTTLEELKGFSSRLTTAQRDKRHLASSIPQAPGVYIFRGPKNEPLYVGTSRNLRTRVRNYFTAAETRKRMHEMIAVTHHIDAIVCATILEAQVRELRMINEHKPHYNKRSRFQKMPTWLKTFESVDIREASTRLTKRMNDFSDAELFEKAAVVRNEIHELVRNNSRAHHIHALASLPEIILAKPISTPGLWEFTCIRYGRLAGTALSVPGIDVARTLDSLTMTAEVVVDDGSILPASSHEEVEKLLTYIDDEGTRIVSLKGQWALPILASMTPTFAEVPSLDRYL